MGGDSCSKGCGFESQHHLLDGHFSHLFIVKIVMFVWKDENKRKRGRDGHFLKKVLNSYSLLFCLLTFPKLFEVIKRDVRHVKVVVMKTSPKSSKELRFFSRPNLGWDVSTKSFFERSKVCVATKMIGLSRILHKNDLQMIIWASTLVYKPV